MPNLREVRNRIESVRSTEKITSAMKMVSASKLRKAQTIIHNLRPYSESLDSMVRRIFRSGLKPITTPFHEVRPPEKILIIGIASNRGLCGPFNINLGKAIIQVIHEEYFDQYQQGKIEFFIIGKKLFEYLTARKIQASIRNDELIEKLSPELAEKQLRLIIDSFLQKKYDRVEIFFHHFKNAAVQLLSRLQLLPLQDFRNSNQEIPFYEFDYIFEPSQEEVLNFLIPQYLNVLFFECLVDSAASEHGARMIAMHKATDNAKELLRNLRLSYNKARQAAITNEIIEIISGAEAFKK